LSADTYYYCKVTDICGEEESAIAQVTVNADPAITVQPLGTTICSGFTHNMSVTVTGGVALAYLWQSNSGAGWVTAAGTNNTASYTTAALTQLPIQPQDVIL
jgi:hypothetical protein